MVSQAVKRDFVLHHRLQLSKPVSEARTRIGIPRQLRQFGKELSSPTSAGFRCSFCIIAPLVVNP
jgi:hypothetical protein